VAIDLTRVRPTVERILFGADGDQCTIHRRPPDPTTFDTTSGEYELPAPRLVYEGVCSLKSGITATAGRAEQGAVDATQQRWSLKLPVAASAIDGPRVGDVVTMTVSRDARWTETRFVVRDVGGGTNSVLRNLALDRWEQGSGQDWLGPNP
jgi:hypothetical protein